MRDVIEHHQIRDIDIFNRIVSYCLVNVGRTFSASSISRYLKSEQRKVSVDTVLNYLTFCADAFLIYKVPRQDVAGKAILKAEEKYYAVDHGLREALGFSNSKDIELVLENIVYTELLSRGYKVTIGKVGDKEIDFVAEKNGALEYYQVSYVMPSEQTREREFSVLLEVRDNYPKTVLSLDTVDFSRDGIVHRNLIDFLLQG
ncbi:MAG: DUF4143 domain-containing protein [Rothia sp. (in: high G+C Gram-positive bacteria)]|nr:DUF4143 domain-containing protein [Rothia sp. (in: high G+C Gram-positive bacteria)]